MIQRAFGGGGLARFALRVGAVREGKQFEAVSREGALVVNNLLLSAILGIVLVGTLYPLGVEAVTGEKLSVGPPYFNSAARAEEHTSELQSLMRISYAVFCLKKQTHTTTPKKKWILNNATVTPSC